MLKTVAGNINFVYLLLANVSVGHKRLGNGLFFNIFIYLKLEKL